MEENEPVTVPDPEVAIEPAGRQRIYKRIARIAAYTILAMVMGSLIWVLVYRFAMPPATFLTLRDRLAGKDVQRQPVRLTDISPHLYRAVIASEDQAFCTHNGFDWAAIAKARDFNEQSSRTRGASTITMQTAKNAFLWPSRSWVRKGVEAYFTLLIEGFWPKQRILEVYLSMAEWGPGIFGAEAAARYHFGKSAAQLTTYEAALLAAALPSPLRSQPSRPSAFLTGRANEIHSITDKIDTGCSQK
ncbi:MAG: monofunctional biosynthetic peptidoglycan transglycosylase [Rhodothermaceae bacterium]|nr:monofunctional biosynthetic peptidoglycan transglycosylase [Rhodothermaceae bacterium]